MEEKTNREDKEKEGMRLQKYIAKTGLCSRRKAEEYILNGDIYVNDEKIIVPYYNVKENNVVKYKDKILELEDSFKYYILNKPLGYISTSNDKHAEKKAIDLIKTDVRLVSAGRLDKDTTGALIFSNDGDFVNIITHPKHMLEKEYVILLKKEANENDIKRLTDGVMLDDGYITKKAKAWFGENKKEIHLVINEGKNRQVRRMVDSLNLELVSLHRRRIGNINVDDLRAGEYRQLDSNDIKYIYSLR